MKEKLFIVVGGKAYVGVKIAKALHAAGFNEMCERCYGLSVTYKGREIDFDEECELKSSGKGNEIKREKYGHLYRFNNTNDTSVTSLSCPSLDDTCSWLRERGVHIMVNCIGEKNWLPTIQFMRSGKDALVNGKESKMGGNGFDSYEEALSEAIYQYLTTDKK